MIPPLVSIVTISYNQAEFLEEAIKSVLNQTYKNIEYIIFDGGSTDGSVEIINRYRDSLAHVNIGPDGGPPAALNAGFEIARGTIHAYLNSDDVLHPQTVETWVRAFGRFPNADIIFGDIEIIDGKGKRSHLPGRRVSKFLAGPFSVRRYAAGASVIPQQASAWRRQVFKKVGGFVENNATCWDYEFFVDAVLNDFKVKRISGVLAQFRVHSQSISGTNRHQERRRIDHSRVRNKWDSAEIIISRIERAMLIRSSQVARVFRYIFSSLQ